jgi:hypothetical protein
MTEEEFVAAIRAGHQGRLMRRKLRALHHIARTSIGIEASAWSVSMEISFLVEKFSLIKQHIRIIERTMVRLVDETEEGKYLLSIRGLNYIAVAGLLAELGRKKAKPLSATLCSRRLKTFLYPPCSRLVRLRSCFSSFLTT